MSSKIIELAIEASIESEILLHINEENELVKLPFTGCVDNVSTLSGINFITNEPLEINKESIVGYTWWIPEQDDAKKIYINNIKNKIKFLNDFIQKVKKNIVYSYSLNNIYFSESSNPVALYVFDFYKNIDLNNISKLEYAKERWLDVINIFKEDQINILEEEKISIISSLSDEHKDYFISDFEKLKNVIVEKASDTNIFSNCKTPGDVALCWPTVLEPNPSISISML